jgi:hypothetical protein
MKFVYRAMREIKIKINQLSNLLSVIWIISQFQIGRVFREKASIVDGLGVFFALEIQVQAEH